MIGSDADNSAVEPQEKAGRSVQSFGHLSVRSCQIRGCATRSVSAATSSCTA